MNNNSLRNSRNTLNYNNINNLYRSNIKNQKGNQKITFKSKKNNTITSLNEVECFLNKIQNTLRYIKLYKLLK